MSRSPGFAVWITGLPASGKSSVTRELVSQLNAAGISPVVLESDLLRTILTPKPTFSQEERDLFYHQVAELGVMITRHGVPVIFDATANRRAYRDHARGAISRYLEILIDTPLDDCRRRDPKGIYRAAGSSSTATVPGIQVPYERPQTPELTLDGRDDPAGNAARIFTLLRSSGCI